MFDENLDSCKFAEKPLLAYHYFTHKIMLLGAPPSFSLLLCFFLLQLYFPGACCWIAFYFLSNFLAISIACHWKKNQSILHIVGIFIQETRRFLAIFIACHLTKKKQAARLVSGAYVIFKWVIRPLPCANLPTDKTLRMARKKRLIK